MRVDLVFRSRRSNVLARGGMVATSQPLAALAGLDVLRAGGNAADAAVAAAAMLNVVEPISTGVGGDCFALHWDAAARAVTALNGSGRAAAAASLTELRARGLTRMPEVSGEAVTVPGTVAAWCDLLDRHGSMPLAEVLAPAIRAAEQGYPVSELIALGWQTQVDKLLRGTRELGDPQPSGAELLLEGRAPRAGEVMRLPALAATLRGIAGGGRAYFYEGDLAARLSAHVQRYGGWLTPADLAAHRSTWDAPIAVEYRGMTLWECPPNSQGLAASLAAALAAGFEIAALPDADRAHLLIECMRLAFADAGRWVADPAMARLPLAELLDPAYLASRRARIDPTRAAAEAPAGDPERGADTVYLAVVDGRGNACSLINSLYAGVGTGLVVPGTGVSLQNRGALFSLDPAHPNALAPGKRPYQTIIPALTTRGGELHACFGVMGGFMQPQGHLQVLSNLVDREMSPQQALDMPRWFLPGPALGGMGAGEGGGQVLLEEGWPDGVAEELSRRGHRVTVIEGLGRHLFGGGQVIARDPATGVLIGGSDPRKDGCAIGF